MEDFLTIFVIIWFTCGLIGLGMMFSRGVLGFFKSLVLVFFLGWLVFPLIIALGPFSILIARIRKRCPYCRQSIASGASICPYCQRPQ